MDASQINLSNLTTAITQLTETVTAHGSELKAIQARLAVQSTPPQAVKPASDPKIADLEPQLAAVTDASKVAARAQAERAVAAAAVEGKFPPQDQELFKQLVDVFAANPDAGKGILARMPTNPALQTIVATGSAGRATFGPTEPATQFALLVKARSSELKGDRCRALDAAIGERPDLYKAWREANGQPRL